MTKGERVLEIRKALDLTMDKFGEKLGVKKSAISKVEKGRVNLSDQMALAICREYNVNYDYLMNGEGEMFNDIPQTALDELCAQYGLNKVDKALIKMYAEMPEETREYLKNEIRKCFLEENQ